MQASSRRKELNILTSRKCRRNAIKIGDIGGVWNKVDPESMIISTDAEQKWELCSRS